MTLTKNFIIYGTVTHLNNGFCSRFRKLIGTTVIPATLSTSLVGTLTGFIASAASLMPTLISVLRFGQVTAVTMDICDLLIRHFILFGATPTRAAAAQLI